MLAVFPFFYKDVQQVIAVLEWAKELDDRLPFECLLSYEDGTPHVERVKQVAESLFAKVHLYCYPPAFIKTWPQGPNHAWQNTARYIPYITKEPWVWIESDAIPIRPGWLQAIAEEHKRGGKAFTGCIVPGLGHMTGVGVYPNDVSQYVVRALLCQNAAWDVVMKEEMIEQCHCAYNLFGHVWGIVNGEARHAEGDPPVFTELQQVYQWVNLDGALFHRCKDTSLIKWLRHMRSAEFNVPQLTVKQEAPPAPEPKQTYPSTEIFIVTYHKDAEWLRYCLRSVWKFCTGFQGVTLVVPERDYAVFGPLLSEFDAMPLSVVWFKEIDGKGMLQHMALECMGDLQAPLGTQCVLHLDADTIFNGPTDVSQFFRNGKPIYVWRTYDSLYDPKRQVNSDCVIWKEPTENALGFSTNVYGMCTMPCINDVRLFPEFRKWIEAQHKMRFEDWATSGRNEFPQSWSEYAALGAFAKELMPELYHWIDCANEAVPKENSFHFHSHSGLTPQIREQIEGWLK